MSASQTHRQYVQFVATLAREGQFGIALDQLQPLQTRMPVLADDDVVVHGNPEWRGDVGDRLGHLDVGLRWRGIAGGMVVRQPTRRRTSLIRFDFRIQRS